MEAILDKCYFIVCETDMHSVRVKTETISVLLSAKIFGVAIDNELKFKNHVYQMDDGLSKITS